MQTHLWGVCMAIRAAAASGENSHLCTVAHLKLDRKIWGSVAVAGNSFPFGGMTRMSYRSNCRYATVR